MVSAWVVGMPCGKPGYVLSVSFCKSFTEKGAEGVFLPFGSITTWSRPQCSQARSREGGRRFPEPASRALNWEDVRWRRLSTSREHSNELGATIGK